MKSLYSFLVLFKHTITALIILIVSGFSSIVKSQSQLPVIEASNEQAHIKDGKYVEVNWKLDPALKPDTYFINIPLKKSVVHFKTDKGSLTFRTQPGKNYDFIVVLNKKDSCHVRISSTQPPNPAHLISKNSFPQIIPFKLIGSRIYFDGLINGKSVTVQFDLGAGTSVINTKSVERLGLSFTSQTLINNTNGINQARTSLDNELKLAVLHWTGISLTEVRNMQDYEDIIIGNSFFKDKIIEIDYDKKQFIIHSQLLSTKGFKKQPVFYEQDRPKFNVKFSHNNKNYDFWFLFDTGRDGTMLLGEDFTSKKDYWEQLVPLTTINDKKIVRLDATISGVYFKDIVTNAADPNKPKGKTSLFGNQVLNHFNVILDNRKGILYIKPNSRTYEPYSDYQNYLKEISKMQKK
ncbi:retropepsin-like aspartic protease [Chryseobacterium geocarposphaerae]|uniref:Gag-polyprotein putative aspartyl protease n=1 Tax=Chryseobacterium geocarposphaerae TaxID=1416776 RepID=A0A2M9C751_9FLAO|nr:retropepsin-like aspartic protease [Chryseobacterium geocarposphaerae]PJJ66643.1 gag-polyprotein putative aspartyl protease [Chryseobacterium geocarposphaerae]